MTPVPIPLFPLHVVLFPGASLPLHVFEPRYRTMMATVLGTEDNPAPEPSFGVASIREGFEVGAPAETHVIGCLAVVTWLERHADGSMDLVVRGTRRYRVVDRPPDDPYPRAEISFLDEPTGPRPEEALRLARSALERYASVVARVAGAERPAVALPDEPVAASYAAAGMLAVDAALRQELLEIPGASERLARAASIARAEASLLET